MRDILDKTDYMYSGTYAYMRCMHLPYLFLRCCGLARWRHVDPAFAYRTRFTICCRFMVRLSRYPLSAGTSEFLLFLPDTYCPRHGSAEISECHQTVVRVLLGGLIRIASVLSSLSFFIIGRTPPRCAQGHIGPLSTEKQDPRK